MSEKTKIKIDIKQFLKVIKWILTLYLRMSPIRTTFLMLTGIASSSRGLVMTFLFGKLIDVVTMQALSQSPDLTTVYSPLLFLFIYYLIFKGVLNEIGYYCRRSLGYLSRSELNIIFYQKMNELGVQTLEQD